MQNRDNSSSAANSENKGYSLFVGGTYIGFLNIAEFTGSGRARKRNLPEATVANMEVEANMKALLDQADFKLKVPHVEADTTDLDSIMSGVDQNIGQHAEETVES